MRRARLDKLVASLIGAMGGGFDEEFSKLGQFVAVLAP